MSVSYFQTTVIAAVFALGCAASSDETGGSGTASQKSSRDSGSVACKPGDFPPACKTFDDYNEATSQFDLVSTIGMTGRVARIHYSVVSPGGVIGLHRHENRPCFGYILQGEATETKQGKDGKVVVARLKTDEVEKETTDISHWWKNETQGMVRMIAVDIFADTNPTFWRATGVPRTTPYSPPPKPDNIRIDDLGVIDLGDQFPEISATKDFVMRSRRLTLLPRQVSPVYTTRQRPAYIYVVRGNVLEHRSDQESSIRRPEAFLIEDGDVSYYLENPTSEVVVMWVVDFAKKGTP